MPKEKIQSLAETGKGYYYNQQDWLEEFLDNKGSIQNGTEAADGSVLQEKVFLKIYKLHRKTPVLVSPFVKVGNFIKKRLKHRCFPVKFVKFLRTNILQNICKQLFLMVVKVMKVKMMMSYNEGSSHSQTFFKIRILKNFANFTGKHLCWSIFVIKLQGLRQLY